MANIQNNQHMFESLYSNKQTVQKPATVSTLTKSNLQEKTTPIKKTIAPTKKQQKKDEPIFSAKDIEWFEKIIKSEFTLSPMLSVYLMSNSMKEKLKSELSIHLLLKKLPTSFQKISIIGTQLIDETMYWQEIFDHYLTLTPTFIFSNNKKDIIYLLDQCREFWNYLYIPLQEQYNVMLEDIITYNYSPFKIDINLFKY